MSKFMSDFAPTRKEFLIWLFQFLDPKKKMDIFALLEENKFHINVEESGWNLRSEDRTELAAARREWVNF